MSDTSKAPPAWLVDGIGRVRNALNVATGSAVALPDGAPPPPGMPFDLQMHGGGRERTASNYAKSLSRKVFDHIRAVPTAGPASLVETGRA